MLTRKQIAQVQKMEASIHAYHPTAKKKSKGGLIEFRPRLDKTNFVKDEIIAKNADIYFEMLDDDCGLLIITTESQTADVVIYVGEEITNDEGEKVRPLMLRVREIS